MVPEMTPAAPLPNFQAAVERPLSVVFRAPDGALQGHDYRVEVITERRGLDGFDVVVDFRDLEAALDAILAPMDRKVLDLEGPAALARQLTTALAPTVPAPARIAEVALADGRGRRTAFRP